MDTIAGGARIELVDLTRLFGEVVAVKDLSLRIAAGEFLTLLGPSGSGKSTILMMVAGFLVPSRGDVLVNGRSIVGLEPHRRDLGVVFQNYALFPHLTVFENVAFPLKLRRKPHEEVRERVGRVLDLVGLPGLQWRRPHQLSGGQQQRVALARALIFSPSALLMDEPLGALDKKLRVRMQRELKDIQRVLGVTTLYVTHDQEEAMAMSDRIAVLHQGRLEQVAPPRDLHLRPANAFVAGFLGDANFLRAAVQHIDAETFTVKAENGLQIKVDGSLPPAVGTDVTLLLRPEHIVPLSAGQSAGNDYEAIIDDVLFLGGVIRCRVRLPNGTTLNMLGTAPSFAKIVGIGESIRVGWSPENIRLIEGNPLAPD